MLLAALGRGFLCRSVPGLDIPAAPCMGWEGANDHHGHFWRIESVLHVPSHGQ
jgi:hypothetical protein